KEAGIGYTVLVADDTGGGSVLIPGANGSDFAPQDFSSRVLIARARREIGRSFVSMLATDRESKSNGHNRVFGPDFQCRPLKSEVITGQFLISHTRTPNQPDVTSSWTGENLSSRAGLLQWSHNTTHADASASYKDIGE